MASINGVTERRSRQNNFSAEEMTILLQNTEYTNSCYQRAIIKDNERREGERLAEDLEQSKCVWCFPEHT